MLLKGFIRVKSQIKLLRVLILKILAEKNLNFY